MASEQREAMVRASHREVTSSSARKGSWHGGSDMAASPRFVSGVQGCRTVHLNFLVACVGCRLSSRSLLAAAPLNGVQSLLVQKPEKQPSTQDHNAKFPDRLSNQAI